MANSILVETLLNNGICEVDSEDVKGIFIHSLLIHLLSRSHCPPLLDDAKLDRRGQRVIILRRVGGLRRFPGHDAGAHCRQGRDARFGQRLTLNQDKLLQINLLLYYKADICAIDKAGKSPFDLACEYGNLKVIESKIID
jgi:ankyrin repeat protein